MIIVFLNNYFRLLKSLPPKSDVFSRPNANEFLIIFSLLTVMFYMKGLVRVSIEHMQLALIPSMMILAFLIEIAIINTKSFKAIIVVVSAISFGTALISGYQKISHKNGLVFYDFPRFYELRSNSKSAFIVEKDRNAAIRFIVQNTAQNERVFIGLTRHDKIFINDVSSYFQTNRLPATKWHHFDPGLQSSFEIQSKIIDDLEQNKPRYIWLESTWDKVNEPNESANSSGIIILDEYIHREYKLAQNFGKILVWQRNY